jgi:ABC-type Zn uptake system ZnuABC Zn-binding protein ZnuA
MKNKYILATLVIILVIIGVLFFQKDNLSGEVNNNLEVVTTLYPLYEFAKEVGGEKIEVSLLLPPGAEAHTFEPKPSDIVKINNADFFVYIGEGMEPWAYDIVEGINNKELTLLDASSKVTLLKTSDHEEHSDEHEEGEYSFEWAGVFELKKGIYTWSSSKVDGEYADPAMHMVFLQTTSSDSEGIESKEELATSLFLKNSIKKSNGDTLTSGEFNYELIFDESKEVTTFKIEITQAGSYVFYTEHMPTEFESAEHFFKDSNKEDIEVAAQEPEGEAHRHHGEYDPHIWLDFENDQKIVNTIAELFSDKDPENKEYYFLNAKKYNAKLSKLHLDYTNSLSNCKQKEFISGGHNAFSYLANKYDLETISAFGISPDSEPTPQKIKEIVDLTKEHKIKYIYFEKLVNPKMAETIAKEAGAKTLILNPAHNLLKEQFEEGVTFVSLMEENLANLKIGLECN